MPWNGGGVKNKRMASGWWQRDGGKEWSVFRSA